MSVSVFDDDRVFTVAGPSALKGVGRLRNALRAPAVSLEFDHAL